jgi:hypothetical protein
MANIAISVSHEIRHWNFQETDFEKEMDLVAEKSNIQKNSDKFEANPCAEFKGLTENKMEGFVSKLKYFCMHRKVCG